MINSTNLTVSHAGLFGEINKRKIIKSFYSPNLFLTKKNKLKIDV